MTRQSKQTLTCFEFHLPLIQSRLFFSAYCRVISYMGLYVTAYHKYYLNENKYSIKIKLQTHMNTQSKFWKLHFPPLDWPIITKYSATTRDYNIFAGLRPFPCIKEESLQLQCRWIDNKKRKCLIYWLKIYKILFHVT